MIPLLVVIAGSIAVSVGFALIYLPAGLIAAGVAAVLIGLFLLDVEDADANRSRGRTASPP